MTELGVTPGVTAVAAHYGGLLDGLVIDQADAEEASVLRGMGLEALVTDAVMVTDEDRARLAGEVLAFARGLESADLLDRRAS